MWKQGQKCDILRTELLYVVLFHWLFLASNGLMNTHSTYLVILNVEICLILIEIKIMFKKGSLGTDHEVNKYTDKYTEPELHFWVI